MKTARLIAMTACALVLLALPTGSPAGASVYEGTVIFDCEEVDATGNGPHTLDRDNTGTGNEALNVLVTDGVGTVLVDFDYDSPLATYSGGIGDFEYDTPPLANPITFTLTSLAGNGLPEQVDYVQVGECEGLPYAAPTATAPESATVGETVTVSGSGCNGLPVTVRLLETGGASEALATAEGTADDAGGFAVELTVPADAPVGERVIAVRCGPATDPMSDPAVLSIALVAQPEPTPSTEAPTTSAAPATPARDGGTRPRFTG